jgi:hypothetical protein
VKVVEVDAPFVYAGASGPVRRPSGGSVTVHRGDPVRPDELGAGELERLALLGSIDVVTADPLKLNGRGVEYRAAGPSGKLAETWASLQRRRDDALIADVVREAYWRPRAHVADLIRHLPDRLKDPAAAAIRDAREASA